MTTTKTLIKVTIGFERPWAVGTVSNREDVHLPILVDPRSKDGKKPYLPATSLVGPLRVHLGRELAEEWLGPEPRKADDEDHDKRVASKLWALGTRLSLNQKLDQFPTTSVDARRGAAGEGSLRVQQRTKVTSTETATLDWFLTADKPVPQEIIDKLRTWHFFVGRGRGTGHGLARVTAIEVAKLDLADPGQLTWWLTARHAWMAGAGGVPLLNAADPPEIASQPDFSQLTYDWQVEEPIAVGGDDPVERPEATTGRSMAARTIRRSGLGEPIIPGSSWRGVFRHRLEFILTAVGLVVENAEEAEEEDSDRTEIVEHLFGHASESSSGEQRGRRGVLRFLESTFEPPEGAEEVRHRSHVAIDRITGGAAPGLLFEVTAVRPASTCTLTIESDQVLDDQLQNLLNHVAKDINDGLIGVGGMTTRGYGSLTLVQSCQPQPIDVDDLRSCAARLRAARQVESAEPEASTEESA